MVRCAHCDKEVKFLCSDCWRCENCKLDCKNHMNRKIDGTIEKGDKK